MISFCETNHEYLGQNIQKKETIRLAFGRMSSLFLFGVGIRTAGPWKMASPQGVKNPYRALRGIKKVNFTGASKLFTPSLQYFSLLFTNSTGNWLEASLLWKRANKADPQGGLLPADRNKKKIFQQ